MTLKTTNHNSHLPHQGNKIYIADGGLETTFIFLKNTDLPEFAAFDLLNSDSGIDGLRDYYQDYINIALRNKLGLILDTPTWRASTGWGYKLGYTPADIREYNLSSVSLMKSIRDRNISEDSPMIINGAIGPQDDGYNPAQLLSVDEAEQYHSHQVGALADAGVDMISAVTMTYAEEAIGVTRAAQSRGVPVAISFTVETDGQLPNGMSLKDAIETVDSVTKSTPVYYMINCAHPSHFSHVLKNDARWMDRIVGLRANASCMSHAELDEAIELDDGNPVEFGQSYAELNQQLKNLRVFGGCCGTDHRHISEVCKSLVPGEPGRSAA